MSAILLNPFWCRLHFHQKFDGALRRFSISLRNLSVRDFILRPWQRQKRKIKNFPFLAFHSLVSPMVSAPFMLFREKPNECLQWRPHNKNSKPFSSLITSSHKNPKREKPSKATTRFLFLEWETRKRALLKNHHEVATGEKSKKRHLKKGAKMGIFGVFFLVFIIKG